MWGGDLSLLSGDLHGQAATQVRDQPILLSTCTPRPSLNMVSSSHPVTGVLLIWSSGGAQRWLFCDLVLILCGHGGRQAQYLPIGLLRPPHCWHIFPPLKPLTPSTSEWNANVSARQLGLCYVASAFCLTFSRSLSCSLAPLAFPQRRPYTRSFFSFEKLISPSGKLFSLQILAQASLPPESILSHFQVCWVRFNFLFFHPAQPPHSCIAVHCPKLPIGLLKQACLHTVT